MSASSGMLYGGKNTGRKYIHEVIELCLEEQKEEIVALSSSTSCYDEVSQTTSDGAVGAWNLE